MNCQQIDKYIYEFCDNRLAPQMQDGIKAHLDHCESCRDKVAAARHEGHLLRSMETIPPLQPDFTARVIALIQGNSGRRRAGLFARGAFGRSRPLRWWWGAAGAAVLLLVLYSLPLLQQPVGIRLAEQNDPGSLQTETLPAAMNSIPEISPKPEGTQVAESVIETEIEAIKETVKEPVAESAPEPRARYDQVAMQDSPTSASPNHTALRQASPHVPETRSASIAAAPVDQAIKSPYPTNPNRGVGLLTLHPTNLPSEYSLQTVISNSEQDITFIYKNQVTQQELSLRLTAVTNQSDQVEMENLANDTQLKSVSLDEDEGSEGSLPAGGSLPAEKLLINSYQSSMNHNQHLYQLVVTGNLSTEELAAIAKSIKLEEGIPDEEQDNP